MTLCLGLELPSHRQAVEGLENLKVGATWWKQILNLVFFLYLINDTFISCDPEKIVVETIPRLLDKGAGGSFHFGTSSTEGSLRPSSVSQKCPYISFTV